MNHHSRLERLNPPEASEARQHILRKLTPIRQYYQFEKWDYSDQRT